MSPALTSGPPSGLISRSSQEMYFRGPAERGLVDYLTFPLGYKYLMLGYKQSGPPSKSDSPSWLILMTIHAKAILISQMQIWPSKISTKFAAAKQPCDCFVSEVMYPPHNIDTDQNFGMRGTFAHIHCSLSLNVISEEYGVNLDGALEIKLA